MCGIAGFVAPGRRLSHERAILSMVDALRHRGPDDEGVMLHEVARGSGPYTVALGNRRLAIIDRSPAGHQPMSTADGRVSVTFNGEIYNFGELRDELIRAGFRFRSGADTEVLLHGYEAWRIEGLLARLNGMFGFALWDAHARRMYLARDRLGEKQVYYAFQDGRLVFASEIRGIMASGLIECALDAAGVYAYLAMGSVPAPLTMVEPLSALEPGCYLELSGERMVLRRYWQLAAGDIGVTSEAEAERRLEALLVEAVRARMVSDVPLGLFLSGGTDSTALLALMRRVSDAPLHAHAISFPQSALDESVFARRAAQRFGAELHTHVVTAGQLAAELPQLISALDQPSIDGVNTYFVSKFTREAGTVVALSGIGGDELFGGYSSFGRVARLRRAGLALDTLGPARWALERILARGGPRTRAGRLRDFIRREPSIDSAYLAVRGLFCESEITALLEPGLLAGARRGFDPLAYLAGLPGDTAREPGNAVSMLELRVYMHNQLLRDTDVMSMAHGLEVRCPLLDYWLVEFALGLPAPLKFGGRPKGLLIAALGGEIPSEIVQRPKAGFTFPFEQWMRGACRDQLAAVSVLPDEGVLAMAAARAAWDGFAHRRVPWARVWALVVLRLWLDQFRRSQRDLKRPMAGVGVYEIAAEYQG